MMPCRRQTSAVAMPASCRFTIELIYAFENLLRIIRPSPRETDSTQKLRPFTCARRAARTPGEAGSRCCPGSAAAATPTTRAAGHGRGDHRFALRTPALLSIPDKTPSPASAFRSSHAAASSRPWVRSRTAEPDPKTPAAPFCHCAFRAVIWCGWTSNSLVSDRQHCPRFQGDTIAY